MTSRLILVAALCTAILVSACGSTTSGSAVESSSESIPPEPPQNKSTIVSQMENYYEENPEISIDPCHDSFIHDMAKIGYALDADVILPEGQQYSGYWHASCRYRSDQLSVGVRSSTAPFMMPGETLEPRHKDKGWSYLIEISGRSSVVLPPANDGESCMVSMSTTYGSMTIIGRAPGDPKPEENCTRIIDLLHQIEPWIND